MKPFLGIAAYGLMSPKFPDKTCDKLLDALSASPRPITSVLWGSFGKDSRCLKRYLERFEKIKHALVIHLSNEVCKRHGTCTNRDKFDLFDRLAEVFQVLGPYSYNPYLTLYISTGLEAQFSEDEHYERAYEINRTFPESVAVANVIDDAPDPDGLLHEFHNEDRISRIKFGICNDGFSIADTLDSKGLQFRNDYIKRARQFIQRNLARKARYIMLWERDLQGLKVFADGSANYTIKPHNRNISVRLGLLSAMKEALTDWKI